MPTDTNPLKHDSIKPEAIMTTSSASSHRFTMSLFQHFKESPEVKKQKARLAGDDRSAFMKMLVSIVSDAVSGLIYATLIFCLVATIAYSMHQQNEPWVAITGIIIYALVVPGGAMLVNHNEIRWLLTEADSPFVLHKLRRRSIKAARLAAGRLGTTVIPVLTEEHVASVERVHSAMTTAAGSSQRQRSNNPSEYNRLTSLLFQDLSRETMLLDLITNRGITDMDDIEAALKDIEANTIRPLQSGWL